MMKSDYLFQHPDLGHIERFYQCGIYIYIYIVVVALVVFLRMYTYYITSRGDLPMAGRLAYGMYLCS